MPHDHDHEHDHNHDHDHNDQNDTHALPSELTENQKDFLHQLNHLQYLPVARFTLTDSREKDFASTALAPVFIRSLSDDMATVKEAGTFLQKLEDLGLITLDYDIPLDGYGYEEYTESAIYEYFRATVAEGASKPGFLGNTPLLESGSMALTEIGKQIAAEHCAHDDDHHHG